MLNPLFHLLEEHLNMYIIIFILFAVYYLLQYGSSKWLKKELRKRKDIIEEIEKIKEPYIKENEETHSNPVIHYLLTKNPYLTTLKLQETLGEEELLTINQKSKKIKEEKRAKPYMIIIYFMIPLFFFVQVLLYLNEITAIDYSIILPITTAIVTFFTNVTRKRLWIFLVMSTLLFVVYQHLSGASNIFLLCYFSVQFIKKRVLPKKK